MVCLHFLYIGKAVKYKSQSATGSNIKLEKPRKLADFEHCKENKIECEFTQKWLLNAQIYDYVK